jgi:hypothetical protein
VDNLEKPGQKSLEKPPPALQNQVGKTCGELFANKPQAVYRNRFVPGQK